MSRVCTHAPYPVLTGELWSAYHDDSLDHVFMAPHCINFGLHGSPQHIGAVTLATNPHLDDGNVHLIGSTAQSRYYMGYISLNYTTRAIS